MKAAILILALILPLSGCVNQGQGWGVYPDSPFYELRKAGDKVFETEWFVLPGTRAMERKLDEALQDATPWRPKDGSCGASILCDD